MTEINCIDILIYVALSEEFDALKKDLGDKFSPKEFTDVALTSFYGQIYSPVLNKKFKVAVVPAGKMGNTRAATATSTLIEKLRPTDIIVLGIAGSLSNDMEPGDVFVPDSVNEYLANSATIGKYKSWKFTISGNSFQTSLRLLNRLQVFAHTQPAHYADWEKGAEKRRAELISEKDEKALTDADIVTRGKAKLFAGDDRKLASGPAVGKGKAFTDWIRGEVDRKVSALEMESAGVYDAAIVRTPAPRTIAIRGISDYADARKEKIEKAAAGKVRELSARNALSLLTHAIEAGLFSSDYSTSVGGESSDDELSVNSQVRSVFVIGGVTGETDDVDAEEARLNQASLSLGKALAAAGVQLVVCSPFPDSADYYTAMGYAGAKCGGTIQFHSPSHPQVTEKRRLLQNTLGTADLTIQDWNYPSPEGDDEGAWRQAWLLAQVQALERADVVVALGGKGSQSASTLLHLAEAKGLPIVPYTFLSGAARRAYDRRDWKRLNPGFDPSVLASPDKIGNVVLIANRLSLDRVKRMTIPEKKPDRIFISVARQDAAMGSVLGDILKNHGIQAVVGDHEIRTDQMIPASIEQALLGSDVCAVFWSRHYAQSPWCFDELSLAVEHQSSGTMAIWMFNLDDSAIVPKFARKLPAILVRNKADIGSIVSDLLK